MRGSDKKLGRRKAGTYGRTAKPAQKRIANKATRRAQKFVINKDIPVPEHVTRNNIYPWSEMEVGDSFYFTESKVRCSATCWGKRHNITFTTRTWGDGWRIWRTS